MFDIESPMFFDYRDDALKEALSWAEDARYIICVGLQIYQTKERRIRNWAVWPYGSMRIDGLDASSIRYVLPNGEVTMPIVGKEHR